MALSVTKEGQLIPPTVPTIYGKQLNWHAVRDEHASLKRQEILPYQRTASVFRQSKGTLRLEIEAFADEHSVRLYPNPDRYIGFTANVITTSDGLRMVDFTANLKYPFEAGPLLHGKRYDGMPYLHEISPTVVAYFDSFGRIDGKRSRWENDQSSDNYRAFTAALNQGTPPMDAVKTTPAWVDAKHLGFTEISVPIKDQRGNWTVDFYRPGTTTRRQPFS